MTNIETPRLFLRRFRPEDSNALLEILACPRASCFEDEKLSGPEEALESAQWRSDAPHGTQVAIFLKENSKMIGYLFGQVEEQDTWSVGWNFNSTFEGKGYAMEAVRAYLNYLFTEIGARRIYAYAAADNARSLRLCERLGMRREGVLKEFVSFIKDCGGNDIYEDICVYAILSKEWRFSQEMPRE